jgi:hypothetical protein
MSSGVVRAALLVAVTASLACSTPGSGGGMPFSPTVTLEAIFAGLTDVTPKTGSTAGGTRIQITGGGWFASGTVVTVGGVAATGVTVESIRSLSATTAPHAAGVVDVVVTAPGGESGTLKSAFTYIAP